jgi:hypothetical protein
MLYRIGKIDGTCNCEFFRSFYLEEFEARDDADAFAKVEKMQDQCERKMKKAGVALTDYDPCLMSHIEKETSDGWIEVEY